MAFYWWLGDPLTRDRLAWQLDRLAGKGVSGLQVNYAHSDKGGPYWGLTYASEPPLMSEPWWNLYGWFLKAARERGMATSLSDYTLGPGQGWYFDEIQREHPELRGAALARAHVDCAGGRPCEFRPPAAAVSTRAWRLRNENLEGPPVALEARIRAGALDWTPPAGNWRIVSVYPETAPLSYDPLNPISGREVVSKFFQRFEDRNPGEAGRGLNFFFSDELNFGVRGWLWSGDFPREFQRRKGYDILPELAALFEDAGPRTPKIRLDYSDVMVSLEEERFFRPVFEWHQSRGMLYGCDHGGRGRDVTEFGDYFRTQRWMTGPGNDQPNLSSEVVKNKVASSIAHLYERPRTWLEGYHSSGWGTSTAQLTAATFRNFAMGHNLLTLHGLYYSTHGGWWEWAPPCNHFRMPYWPHMGEFLRMSERLSYLLSQGVHRADVAILYPVAPVEAGMGGKESVEAAFSLATRLFPAAIDFDFMDFESLARAEIRGRELRVAGETYRVLVLPAMRAVRYSTLERAAEFARAGGLVIALGALPEASDRAGRNDPRLDALTAALFGPNGRGRRASSPEEAERLVRAAGTPDFVCAAGCENAQPIVLHRRAGARDIYMVYGAPEGAECLFRTAGRAELWNPWSGATTELPVLSAQGGTSRLRMPLGAEEAHLIVFSPGEPSRAVRPEEPSWREIALGGEWQFELEPALDNTWGDFRLPASPDKIGAEARRIYYRDGDSGDSPWRLVTCGFGPRFWKLGPVPDSADPGKLEARLARLDHVDAGNAFGWTPYEYSLREGVEGDPGHEGYHGLKGEVTGDFIALGARKNQMTTTTYENEPGGTRYYLWTSVDVGARTEVRVVTGPRPPAAIWIDGVHPAEASHLTLAPGRHPVLLRYDAPGRYHFILETAAAPPAWSQRQPLAMTWFGKPGVLAFDSRPEVARPVGLYRFQSPPGLRAMTVVANGELEAAAAGAPMRVSLVRRRPDGVREWRVEAVRPDPRPVQVEMRLLQDRGYYGGAALAGPVAFDCAPGLLAPGDWSRIDGLNAYSGGAWYRREFDLPAGKPASVVLDLGGVVSSAEVRVNGRPAGIRVAPPWRFDISGLVRAGENRVEVRVYNTLANHYTTIPTRYRGALASGLLGPVRLRIAER